MSSILTAENVLTIAVIGLVATILTIPDFLMHSGTDFGVYFNNGRLIAQGYIPYRDFWDHKTPGIYLYFAFWHLVLGSSWWAAKASLIPIYTLWGCSIYVFCQVVLGHFVVFSLVVSLTGVYLALRLGFDAARNGVILVLSTSVELLALTFVFSLMTSASSVNLYKQVLLGILAGGTSVIAVIIRQTSITPFVVLGFWSLTEIARNEYCIVYGLYGFVLVFFVSVFVVIMLMIVVDLKTLTAYKQIVRFNFIYAAHNFSPSSIKKWSLVLFDDIALWGVVLTVFDNIKQGRSAEL